MRAFGVLLVACAVGGCSDDGGDQGTRGVVGDAGQASLDGAASIDGGAQCAVDQRYRFNSGSALDGRTYELGSGAKLVVLAALAEAGTSCQQTMLACDGADLSVSNLSAALRDADVLAAFSSEPVAYGSLGMQLSSDWQPTRIDRADGQAIIIGSACSSEPSCRAIPDGVMRLQTLLADLRQFDQTTACTTP